MLGHNSNTVHHWGGLGRDLKQLVTHTLRSAGGGDQCTVPFARMALSSFNSPGTNPRVCDTTFRCMSHQIIQPTQSHIDVTAS